MKHMEICGRCGIKYQPWKMTTGEFAVYSEDRLHNDVVMHDDDYEEVTYNLCPTCTWATIEFMHQGRKADA